MTFLEYLAGIGSGVVAASGAFHFLASSWLSKHLQTHKADLDREMENHKHELSGFADRNRLLLKREEMMFERELAAAADFMKIMDEILPKSWSQSDDWGVAQVSIANKLGLYQVKLQTFSKTHSIALSDAARKYIAAAIVEANDGSLIVAEETGGDDYEFERDLSYEACACVDDFYKAMKNAENQLRNDLKHGSFGN